MATRKKATKKRTSRALTVAETKLLAKLLDKAGHAQPKQTKPNPLSDPKRVSTSDGERFYIKLKKANPGARERVEKLVEAGDYIFEGAQGDVSVFRYAEGSKYARKKLSIPEMTNGMILGEMMSSACKRDFKLYAEAAAELAYRFKSSDLPPGLAQKAYTDTMQYLELRIARRGGPGPIEIGQHLSRLRTARTGSQLFLPS